MPYLPLNRVRKENANFITIGRILEHMLLLTGSIPSKFSKITLLLISNPNAEIRTNIVIDEFYLFVNSCERFILKKCIENFSNLSDKEIDILTNIFTSFHFYEMPKEDEIQEQIAAIAMNVLVEEPKTVYRKH